MRSLFIVSVVTASTLGSRPAARRNALPTQVLRSFVGVVCAVSPDRITDFIPPACGNIADDLCLWARLTEENFVGHALTMVKETHEDELDFDGGPGLQRNIAHLASQGLSEEEVAIELTKRYYHMIRGMKECQPYL